MNIGSCSPHTEIGGVDDAFETESVSGVERGALVAFDSGVQVGGIPNGVGSDV